MEGRMKRSCLFLSRARREVLKGVLGLGFALPVAEMAVARTDDPKRTRPQAGDRFVFAFGDRKSEAIALNDLPLGGPQVLTYPMDPGSGVVRDGSRLNQVLLVRLDPGQFSEETRANAADGVMAYSAVCTHQGCPVSMWEDEAKTLFCSCHASQFDPRNAAEVVAGPAPRRLAMLPLKMEDGALVAAGGFRGRVGFKK
jgi:rieske iron-sulfur protein